MEYEANMVMKRGMKGIVVACGSKYGNGKRNEMVFFVAMWMQIWIRMEE